MWKRIKGFFGGKEEDETPVEVVDEKPKPPVPPAVESDVPKTIPEQLEALATGTRPPDASHAAQLFDTLVRDGRAARALDLARKVLARFPHLTPLALRVAEVHSSRGDDDAAWKALEPMVTEPDAPLSAMVLAAEIAERRGRVQEALALYERVLGRDLDFPQARERVERLRDSGPTQDLAGATLAGDGALARGRYRVERELGRGGAGTVFAAQDLRTARRVALKVYHRRGRGELERLRIEARTPAAIEHPGVVRVFDLDPALGSIAMEWVQGGSVRAELSRGKISKARIHRWVMTMLEAMEFVHRSGWVHRDLKPSNFLLRSDDRVVLTDFGLATPTGEVPLAKGGVGEGTLQYMPPEQRANDPAQPSADVYAFGKSFDELMRAASDLDPETKDAWTEWTQQCLHPDPQRRPDVPTLRAGLTPPE